MMNIAIFGALFLVVAFAAPNLDSRPDERTIIQEIYDNATAWTWTQNVTAGRKVKRQANCFTRWMDFSNGRSNPGWDLQTTGSNQHPAREGWTMHSKPGAAWARMRFADYTFNSYANARTHISVIMRGAPDGGKNSNAYLIETKRKYNLDAAVQDGTKDEIDFSEYYGGSNKATFNVFKSGRTIANFPRNYAVSDAGRRQYKYEIILDNKNRNLQFFLSIDGGPLLGSYQVIGDNVPNKPMELFIGIWDCSGNDWCPGRFTADASMAVQSVWVQECSV